MDIPAAMMAEPEIRAIGGAFSQIEIIGEEAPPPAPEAKARHAAPGEKLKEGERFRHTRHSQIARQFSGGSPAPSRRRPR